MTELILLLFANAGFLVALVGVAGISSEYLIPRLELAKGVKGNPDGAGFLLSKWGLSSVWSDRAVAPLSEWTLFLGLASTVSAVLLGPIIFSGWLSLEKLVAPTLLLLSFLVATVGAIRVGGITHPSVRWLSRAAIISTAISVLLLYGLGPIVVERNAVGVGGIIKWFFGLALFLISSPFFCIPRRFGTLPATVVRVSELVVAIFFIQVFFPPVLFSGALALGEQFIKTVVAVVLFDVVRVVSLSQKTVYFENLVIKAVIPLFLIGCFLYFLGS